MSGLNPKEIVQSYFDRGFRPVFWASQGDVKGPTETDWNKRLYQFSDYKDGYRVGLFTGVEVSPGKFLHDVDIDWLPGNAIAQKLLPMTEFVFGRSSKRISHCFYLLPKALPIVSYKDISEDKGVEGATLIELRGAKTNGEIGLQTMAPPSVWSKNSVREPLAFEKFGDPAFIDSVATLKKYVCYTAIGMLLAKHLGTNGFGHDTRLIWAGFLLRQGIEVEDLIKMGEGISLCTNNLEVHDVRRTVESTAARLKDPKQKIKGGPSLIQLFGANGRRIVKRINEWLGKDSDFQRDKHGDIIKESQENIRRAIQYFDLELSYDEFSEKMLIKELTSEPQPLNDEANNTLWLRIDQEFRFRPTKMFFDVVVKTTTYSQKFHPVKQYLDSLSWDHVPRIDQWLEVYGGAPDTEYHRAVAAITLIAAVRRIRHPGCKYDEMLVLEGDQGINKSSALRALCPKDDWFSDDLPLNVDAKQIIERTLGKWIIEASDLAGKRKTEVEQLKSMLSRQIDGPARMAYAHFPVERARQFILIGTTNSSAYLTDATGARRFWPIKVRKFNVEQLRAMRNQLWAEAAYREMQEESIRLPEKLWAAAGEHQEERREIDAWESILSDAVSQIQPTSSGRRYIATDLLWDLLTIDVSRRDRHGALRISEIMQRLGFHRTRMRNEGRVVVGYVSDSVGLDFDVTDP